LEQIPLTPTARGHLGKNQAPPVFSLAIRPLSSPEGFERRASARNGQWVVYFPDNEDGTDWVFARCGMKTDSFHFQCIIVFTQAKGRESWQDFTEFYCQVF
jgi:hypothetical protein